MRLIETKLAGAFVIEPQLFEDERGFFTRTFSSREFLEHGCNPAVLESNVSFNRLAGTLRGMHFQVTPHAQSKLVRCTAGGIWDAIVDLRPGSRTLRQWFGMELTAANRRALYIPEGFAHGFQTLTDNSEVFYQVSAVYAPESAGGVRWNDPAFGIAWPASPRVISPRDSGYSDFEA